MKKRIKDKERDSIDFGKSRLDPLFNSIFYPTLLSMVFASLFTVADGIFVGQGVGSKAYQIAVEGLPWFSYSAIFFAMNVAIIGYFQATEQNLRATLCMLLRGLVFLVPAFIFMPMFLSPQGVWLAVPVTECMTLGVILLTNKGIISR